MLSLLIVDDEKLARTDIIYKVSRSGFMFKWVMEAASAEEALGIIRAGSPDILITDIMMDETSGIELIRAAQRVNPGIASILISGYSEFSYAREAISLGAIDYLLKPARQSELMRAISRAVARVMRQKYPIALAPGYDAVGYRLSVENSEQLHAFINGLEQKLAFPAAELFSGSAQRFCVALARIETPNGARTGSGEIAGREYDRESTSDRESTFDRESTSDREPTSDRREYDRLRAELHRRIAERGQGWLLSFDNLGLRQQVTIIAASPETDDTAAADDIISLLRDALGTCGAWRTRVKVGVSCVSDDVSSEMVTQARQALDLRLSDSISDAILSVADGIYLWDEWRQRAASVETATHPAGPRPEENMRLYGRFVAEYDVANAIDAAHAILSDTGIGTALHLRMLYVEMMCILARTCARRSGAEIVSMLGAETLGGGAVDSFETRSELEDSLKRTIEAALGQWSGDAKTAGEVESDEVSGGYVDETPDTALGGTAARLRSLPVNHTPDASDTSIGEWQIAEHRLRNISRPPIISHLLDEVKKYIDGNFARSELCTKYLSEKFCISLGYLSASYSKQFGVTISKYIISLRIGHARRLLDTTALSVQDICERCGFNGASYFMRTFKKYVGMTPSEYRVSDVPEAGG